MEYVDLPHYAVPLPSKDSSTLKKVATALPHPHTDNTSPVSNDPMSPRKAALNMLPQILLASTLQGTPTAAPAPKGAPVLLSTRDPLSIPITTVNFKRFVSRVSPVFWIQDRVEEILMWRKGTKRTCVWMAAYAFLCYFPRMALLLPHAILISIILATYPEPHLSTAPLPPAPPPEGTVDWQGNIQAIQNLMGAFADLYDAIIPVVPHLTHATPYTKPLFTLVCVTFALFIPLTYVLPLRPTFLVLGLTPFVLTHPLTRAHILPVLISRLTWDKRLRTRLLRVVDDDKLRDKHWRAEMKEVDLWENERWSNASTSIPANASEEGVVIGGGWSKSNLKPEDRAAWTRGQDGSSGGANGDVSSSNLTFALSPGFQFVETEDWRIDPGALWAHPVESDSNGWVYTNDAWLDPQSTPIEKWRPTGMTRRRRWTRRVYYSSST